MLLKSRGSGVYVTEGLCLGPQVMANEQFMDDIHVFFYIKLASRFGLPLLFVSDI